METLAHIQYREYKKAFLDITKQSEILDDSKFNFIKRTFLNKKRSIELDCNGQYIQDFDIECYINNNNELQSIEPKKIILEIGYDNFRFESYEEFKKTFTNKNPLILHNSHFQRKNLLFEFDCNDTSDILIISKMTYKNFIKSDDFNTQKNLNKLYFQRTKLPRNWNIEYYKGIAYIKYN